MPEFLVVVSVQILCRATPTESGRVLSSLWMMLPFKPFKGGGGLCVCVWGGGGGGTVVQHYLAFAQLSVNFFVRGEIIIIIKEDFWSAHLLHKVGAQGALQ